MELIKKDDKQMLKEFEQSLSDKNYAKRSTFFDKLKKKFK